MNPKYTQTSLIAGISGLTLQLGCYALVDFFAVKSHAHKPVPAEWVAYALMGGMLMGTVLFMLALCDFAKAKGYSGFLGLLGSFSCLGLLIIAFLPDRTKK
jgi:hypothetical protein